jgi:hypothetical protein
MIVDRTMRISARSCRMRSKVEAGTTLVAGSAVIAGDAPRTG